LLIYKLTFWAFLGNLQLESPKNLGKSPKNACFKVQKRLQANKNVREQLLI